MITKHNFADRIEALAFDGKILISDAKCIGLSEEEINSFIASLMFNYMHKGVVGATRQMFYNADRIFIEERLKLSYPDIEDFRIQCIIDRMIDNKLIHEKHGVFHLDKILKRNTLLK